MPTMAMREEVRTSTSGTLAAGAAAHATTVKRSKVNPTRRKTVDAASAGSSEATRAKEGNASNTSERENARSDSEAGSTRGRPRSDSTLCGAPRSNGCAIRTRHGSCAMRRSQTGSTSRTLVAAATDTSREHNSVTASGVANSGPIDCTATEMEVRRC